MMAPSVVLSIAERTLLFITAAIILAPGQLIQKPNGQPQERITLITGVTQYVAVIIVVQVLRVTRRKLIFKVAMGVGTVRVVNDLVAVQALPGLHFYQAGRTRPRRLDCRLLGMRRAKHPCPHAHQQGAGAGTAAAGRWCEGRNYLLIVKPEFC